MLYRTAAVDAAVTTAGHCCYCCGWRGDHESQHRHRNCNWNEWFHEPLNSSTVTRLCWMLMFSILIQAFNIGIYMCVCRSYIMKAYIDDQNRAACHRCRSWYNVLRTILLHSIVIMIIKKRKTTRKNVCAGRRRSNKEYRRHNMAATMKTTRRRRWTPSRNGPPSFTPLNNSFRLSNCRNNNSRVRHQL